MMFENQPTRINRNRYVWSVWEPIDRDLTDVWEPIDRDFTDMFENQ